MRYLLSEPFLVCYDGEPPVGNETPPVVPEPTKTDVKAVPKDQVDKLLAEERKKSEVKVKAVLAEKEQLYNDLLASHTLTDQQRQDYEAKLSDVQKQLHTEKEILLKDKTKLQETLMAEIKKAEQTANEWKTRYTESSVSRDLQAAAEDGGALKPKQVVALLKENSKVVEDNGAMKTVVTVEKTVDGKVQSVDVSPKEAVELMKANVDEFGNLFKTGSAGGVGGNTLPAGTIPLDVKHMTHEQYLQMRKEFLKKK